MKLCMLRKVELYNTNQSYGYTNINYLYEQYGFLGRSVQTDDLGRTEKQCHLHWPHQEERISANSEIAFRLILSKQFSVPAAKSEVEY